MSPILKSRIAGAVVLHAVLAFASGASAESKPRCDAIAKDVQASITKEPNKVLMVVEDALVINEGCACEIIKTAIKASHADAAMVKQIVQTALAVAPKMAPVIMECSGSVPVEAKAETVAKATASGKDAKNVLPEAVVPPKEEGTDYSSAPLDIRGLYLMQPAFGAAVVENNNNNDNEDTGDTGKHHNKPRSPRKPVITPMSPSCGCVTP